MRVGGGPPVVGSISRVSPVAIRTFNGQKTRVPGCPIVTGADHVLPRSCVEISMIEFAAGVWAPSHPTLVPDCRSFVSHVTYTVPALSIAIAGQSA